MRGRAAIFVLALCFQISNAFEFSRLFPLDHRLSRLVSCGQSLGVTKCLTALSAWRAQRAIEAAENNRTRFDLNADLEEFPWEQYSNVSEDNLYTALCDGTEGLLKYRQLTLDMNSGYTFQLGSKGNGTLSIDVIKKSTEGAENTESIGRGYMKKLKKKFINIIPLLLVPGLIMSAILPFVLPTLKLMTVAVGILNNMALSGAVFTLLRNNAFNEVHQHRIIYVNEGYHNEKKYPVFNHHNDHHFAGSNAEVFGEISPHDAEVLVGDDPIKDAHANFPWNGDISNVYYADSKIKRKSNGQKIKEDFIEE